MSNGEKGVMLEVLKNPQAYGEETRREVHNKVVAELERLWRLEQAVKYTAENLSEIANPKVQ